MKVYVLEQLGITGEIDDIIGIYSSKIKAEKEVSKLREDEEVYSVGLEIKTYVVK